MFSLTITERASELIRKEVQRCGIKKPAVYLLEARDGIPPPQELEQMGVSEDIRRRFKEMVVKDPQIDKGARKLLPCIYPRMHFFGLFMVEISGIVFFFPPHLRKKAAGGTLDVGQGALVLFDRTGRVVMPTQA